MKKIHLISGIILSLFVTLHLCNHLVALIGVEAHISTMNFLRLLYRNIIIEPLLLLAVVVQIVSGLSLISKRQWNKGDLYNRLHIYSGIFLAFFLLVHTSATLAGRFIFFVDTNFYYAAMVVNVKPYYFFYIPYYFLGTFSFFVHISCIIRLRIIKKKGKEKGNQLANKLMLTALIPVVLILWGFTYNVELPKKYIDLLDTIFNFL